MVVVVVVVCLLTVISHILKCSSSSISMFINCNITITKSITKWALGTRLGCQVKFGGC